MLLLDPNNPNGSDSDESLLENEGDSFVDADEEMEKPSFDEQGAGDGSSQKSSYGASDAVKQKAKDQAIKGLSKPLNNQVGKIGAKAGLSSKAKADFSHDNIMSPDRLNYDQLKDEAKRRANRSNGGGLSRLTGGQSKDNSHHLSSGSLDGNKNDGAKKATTDSAKKIVGGGGSSHKKNAVNAAALIKKAPIAGEIIDKGQELVGREIGTKLWLIWGLLSLISIILLLTIIGSIVSVLVISIFNLLLVSPKLVYTITLFILDLFGVGEIMHGLNKAGVIDTNKISITGLQKISIVIFDVFLFLLIVLMVVLFIFVNCWIGEQTGGVLGSGVANIVLTGADWWYGTNYAPLINEVCSLVKIN
jgi:hypothetical protein